MATATATRMAKKTTGLDKQNNNFARASRYFVHFIAVTARLRCETAQFHVLWRQRISSTFLKLQYSPLEFNSGNICQHFLLLCVAENA